MSAFTAQEFEERPYLRKRNDRIVEMYERGLSARAVGRSLGLAGPTIVYVLKNRGVKIRVRGDAGPLQAARDAEIVLLRKQGLSHKEISARLERARHTVSVAIRKAAMPAMVRGLRGPAKSRGSVRSRVYAVAHLYNTGPGTMSTDLARRIGVGDSTVLKYLREAGVEIGPRGGRTLSRSSVKRIKALLTNSTLTFNQIGAEFNVHGPVIQGIALGQCYKDVPWPAGKTYRKRFRKILTASQVQKIRRAAVTTNASFEELAARFGVSSAAIAAIVYSKSWLSLPWPAGLKYEGRSQGRRSALTDELVARIKRDVVIGKWNSRQLSLRYPVSEETIRRISLNRAWTHVPWPERETLTAEPGQ